MEVKFENLKGSNLTVDTVYKGGNYGNARDDPLSKLFPRLGIQGGFRKKKRKDDKSKFSYCVLYTSMNELEWPDYLDEETGIFRYYGDNRKPGRLLTATKQGGNRLLEQVFATLNSKKDLQDIPPFFVFKKASEGRDVQFLGLAAPGNPNISPDKDLVAFWRTIGNNRFQNYESYFTILDTKDEPISYEWLLALCEDYENSLDKAPNAWKKFVSEGRDGIVALKAPKIRKIPSKYEQLQCDEQGKLCINEILNHYKDNPTGFEVCATRLVSMMDSNFESFSLTRPWRDGGRDAIGYYNISTGNKANFPLKIDCALEAKCYNEKSSVGVKHMSRLISRIRYRQFGILITTSYVHEQAYKEVVEDGHPILIITASDIAYILRRNSISTDNIKSWLNSIDNTTYRDNQFY